MSQGENCRRAEGLESLEEQLRFLIINVGPKWGRANQVLLPEMVLSFCAE